MNHTLIPYLMAARQAIIAPKVVKVKKSKKQTTTGAPKVVADKKVKKQTINNLKIKR